MIKRAASTLIRPSPSSSACKRCMATASFDEHSHHKGGPSASQSIPPQPTTPSVSSVLYTPVEAQLPTWTPEYVKEYIKERTKQRNGYSSIAQLPTEVMTSFATLLPKTLQQQFSLVSQPALLVRNSMIKVLKRFKNDKEYHTILDGGARVGKSATLFQIVSHQYSLGSLVIYIPNPFSWINGTLPFLRNPKTGLYEHPNVALGIIKQILKVNERALKDHPEMLSFLKLASLRREMAHEALEAFICDPSKPDTLIAIDQVNTLWAQETLYRNSKSEIIPASQFRIVKAFEQLFTARTGNNVVVAATDRSNTRLKSGYNHLITRGINAQNSPTYSKIDIPPLTKDETGKLLQYFLDSKFIHNASNSTALLDKIYAVSCGNVGRMVNDLTRYEAVRSWTA